MSWSCLWAVCACLLVGVGAEESCDAQREEMENTICSLCAQRVDSRLKDMGKWFLMLIVGIIIELFHIVYVLFVVFVLVDCCFFSLSFTSLLKKLELLHDRSFKETALP